MANGEAAALHMLVAKKIAGSVLQLHKDEINAFPSHDAVAEILPDKQMLTRYSGGDGDRPRGGKGVPLPSMHVWGGGGCHIFPSTTLRIFSLMLSSR